MDISDLNNELINLKDINNLKTDFSAKVDNILCKHCKRTSSNGIRCLGMCVADNDY